MKRGGLSRPQTASLVFVIAIIVVSGSYYLISETSTPPQSGTVSEVVSASLAVSNSYSSTSSATISSSSTSSVTTVSHQTSAQQASTSRQASSTSIAQQTSTSTPEIAHVIVILMENEEYGSVIGSAQAPYQNALASEYALAGDYYGVAHPSLPNYLALVAGSTFGVNSDCLPAQCSIPSNVTTIASLLDSHGLSWREYAESMPANCSQVDSPDGLYWTKHNPFVYFEAITGDNGTGTTSSYCDSHVVSLNQFYSDLEAGKLPSYSFITPNICDDAHSCSLSVGDEWLSTFVPKIINSSSFASTAIFITYDEGVTNDIRGGGGQVPCILVSPFAKAGFVSQVAYSHYSLLATVEEIFNLGSLGRNDANATAMSDLFDNGLP